MRAGGNFDETLHIDAEGNLVAATGPLEVRDQPTGLELYAWVFQTRADGLGAANISELGKEHFAEARALLPQGAELSRWDSAEGKTENHGKFERGPATGLAVTIATTPDGDTSVTWWADMVTLEPQKPNGGATST